jgi:hypothetical protein
MNRDDFIKRLEAEGVETVRLRLKDPSNYTDAYRAFAIQWLGEKDAQRVSSNDALQASMAESASRAAKAAERAADEAERANKTANAANTIAIAALAAAIISIIAQIVMAMT